MKRSRIVNFEELENELKETGLIVLGNYKIGTDDEYLKGFATLLLLGPDEPRFWTIFKKSYEFSHIKRNPLDEWSKRTITALANKFGGKPFFPFENNPTLPFYHWAIQSDYIWASPIKLLVHSSRGLMVSFRGALAFKQNLHLDKTISENIKRPCNTCSSPCFTACPVEALTPEHYDAEKCGKFIRTAEGNVCREGCLVRRSCPVGQSLRQKEQSRFHMQAFLK